MISRKLNLAMLLEVSLSIITVCTNVGIRWVLENPWTSRLWLVHAVQDLLREAKLLRTDYCQFKQPWRKATGLLEFKFPKLAEVVQVCNPTHGRCSATGRSISFCKAKMLAVYISLYVPNPTLWRCVMPSPVP